MDASEVSALRRFVRTALPFALPLLALLFGIELTMRGVPSTYSVKREVLETSGRTAHVLVLGSSHEADGIRPLDLGCSAINLANGSQSLFIDVQLAELALREMPELDTVVFGLAHFSFGYRIDRSVESWRAGFYQHYFGIHEPTDAMRLPQLGDYSVAALYDPSQMVIALRNPLEMPMEERGWSGHPDPGGAALSDEGAAMARASQLQRMVDESLRDQTTTELIRGLRLLEARGVRAVFVSMPEHARLRAHLQTETIERNEATLAAIRDAVPAGYLDLRGDPRFHDEDFYNFDHMSRDGAIRASRILGEVLAREGACAER
jgi:hypothetical protein